VEHCIEREVGDEDVDEVDERDEDYGGDDGCPDDTLAPSEKREGDRPTAFFFLFLGPSARWGEVSPSGPWCSWLPEGGSPSEIGSLFSHFLSVFGTFLRQITVS
jgi:hypothetical protein